MLCHLHCSKANVHGIAVGNPEVVPAVHEPVQDSCTCWGCSGCSSTNCSGYAPVDMDGSGKIPLPPLKERPRRRWVLPRFRNELPDPSAQPKLMSMKKDKDQ
ncbi:uncharacterized protein LOC121052467 isoform X2 [Rosa chinensis]|uniref:uncharacterized protein LOC121052467 isoform X2 n=1 Tax=Rosa chinensis TaxID=74649 RepID=UPI001AD8D3F0|nr:uncharacterized protein LOC121052467 isoform X2 [Rosa chinensis]